MDAQTKIIRASHMIDMNDIIREGNPTLRAVAEDVTLPLSDEDIILGEKMMQFLRNSQDPVIAEKMGLRGGVGLAAPQLDISKRIIAVLVPNPELLILFRRLLYVTVKDAFQSIATFLDMSFAMLVLLLNTSTKRVKRNVLNSVVTTQSLFNMKSTILTVSCSTTVSIKTIHLLSRMDS